MPLTPVRDSTCLESTLLLKPWYITWLGWLSGLSAVLQTNGSLVQFLVRAHAWVVGQVPSWGSVKCNQSMYFSHMDVSLPFFLLPFPSLEVKK